MCVCLSKPTVVLETDFWCLLPTGYVLWDPSEQRPNKLSEFRVQILCTQVLNLSKTVDLVPKIWRTARSKLSIISTNKVCHHKPLNPNTNTNITRIHSRQTALSIFWFDFFGVSKVTALLEN